MESVEKLKQELEARYTKNFFFLKFNAPKLFQKALQDGGLDWRIVVTDEGYPNAVINGSPLYPEDPKYIATKQVELFKERPIRIMGDPFTLALRKELIHGRHGIRLHNLRKKYEPYIIKEGKFWDSKNIPVLIVLGTGFGYHIKELIKKFNIQHMIIVDLNPDFFKLSLYAIDWEEIYNYFRDSKYRRSLRVIIEDNEEKLARAIELYLAKICPAFISYIFIFRHMNNPLFEKTTLLLKEMLAETQMLWGFFDDEIWAIEYTVKNALKRIPIYTRSNKLDTDYPVFLIGSGPSLDKSLETIKKFEDKAIIVSCGTAIRPLEKAGIKPDLHIEMERTKVTYDTLKVVSKNFLKDIPIVGFNNLYPKVFDLFERRYIFIKPNDAGSPLFPPYLPRLFKSNPTVTATGFSFMVDVGFKRFFFFGVDLGAKSQEYHHSKMSVYYELENQRAPKFNMKVEGNFGGEVWTDFVFYQNKRVMERLISEFKDKLEVYNTSEGAKIEGTFPLRIEEVESKLSNTHRKKEKILEELFKNFSEEPYKDIDVKTFLKNLEEDMDIFANRYADLKVKTGSLEELMRLLSDIQFFIYELAIARRVRGEYVLYILLLSSIRQFSAEILSVAFSIPYEEKRFSFINEALSIVSDFIKDARREVQKLKKRIKLPI